MSSLPSAGQCQPEEFFSGDFKIADSSGTPLVYRTARLSDIFVWPPASSRSRLVTDCDVCAEAKVRDLDAVLTFTQRGGAWREVTVPLRDGQTHWCPLDAEEIARAIRGRRYGEIGNVEFQISGL